MNITLLPKTTLGKWSTGLIIAAFLMLVVFIIEVVLESRGGVTFDWNGIWPAIPIILAVVFAISSMVIGIIGIVKSRKRSTQSSKSALTMETSSMTMISSLW